MVVPFFECPSLAKLKASYPMPISPILWEGVMILTLKILNSGNPSFPITPGAVSALFG